MPDAPVRLFKEGRNGYTREVGLDVDSLQTSEETQL